MKHEYRYLFFLPYLVHMVFGDTMREMSIFCNLLIIVACLGHKVGSMGPRRL